MGNNDEKIIQIRSRINEIQYKQFQIQRELANIDQEEMEFFEIKERSRKIFERLFHFWHHDKEMMNYIEQEATKLESHHRKIQVELDEKRETLLEEKKKLKQEELELNKTWKL